MISEPHFRIATMVDENGFFEDEDGDSQAPEDDQESEYGTGSARKEAMRRVFSGDVPTSSDEEEEFQGAQRRVEDEFDSPPQRTGHQTPESVKLLNKS